jgi:hypothetical protein
VFLTWRVFLEGTPPRSLRLPLAAPPSFSNFYFPLSRGAFFPATKGMGHASDPAIW